MGEDGFDLSGSKSIQFFYKGHQKSIYSFSDPNSWHPEFVIFGIRLLDLYLSEFDSDQKHMGLSEGTVPGPTRS